VAAPFSIISSELEEVLAVGDRVGVIAQGRIVGITDRALMSTPMARCLMAKARAQPNRQLGRLSVENHVGSCPRARARCARHVCRHRISASVTTA